MNADQFNALYPVGSPVVAYPGARPEDGPNGERLVTRTRSKAQVLGGHTDVVWVDGHEACIALTHVDVTPLVELEAQGCKTWQLTPRNITAVDDEVDRDGIYAKGYWEDVDGKLQVVGLRIGAAGEGRIVARFGDHVIRDRDGRWTVRHAPADTGTEGQA